MEALEWLREFERANGRPLRVLHIGNVANNAYNNAKIQRRHGIDADVACYEYFHVMGSPEWEDAEFEGAVDADRPDWWSVDLHGFRRPAWFAQGRVRSCQRYLLALRRGEHARASFLRRVLDLDRWLRTRGTTAAYLAAGVAGLERPGTPPALRPVQTRIARAQRTTWFAVSTGARKAAVAGRALAEVRAGRSWRYAALMVFPRRLSRLARQDDEEALVDAARRADAARPEPDEELAARFRELFPDRRPLTSADYEIYLPYMPGWERLLEEYDVVQGYATDSIIPLLAHRKNFTAYEHGTLRTIPFEDSPRGRVCALVYREARVVFVTNSDVLESAYRLGLTDEQMVFLPHAVDGEKLARFAHANRSLRPAATTPVELFSPARQDWVSGDPNWSKGNDRAIRGLALARDRGDDCRLVLVEWGTDLAASRALIDELGLAAHVTWVDPMKKRELWTRYLGAHAVVDQFVAPAIGGVAFEAMALGCRVITALDRVAATRFFGAEPPLLASRSDLEIADAMAAVAADPADAAGLGDAAAAWFASRHSAERIVELQLAGYRRIVDAG
jgi:glycosyltransferase involved in cell wall biosynthesis